MKKFLLTITLVANLVPLIAFAASDYVPLAPLPLTTIESGASREGCGAPSSESKTNLCLYLRGAFRLAIALAGALAVLMIVMGGIQYMSTDAIGGKTEGRARIQNALGGLILALASYLLLYTINPSLVELNLNFGPKLRSAAPGSFTVPPEFSEFTAGNQAELAAKSTFGEDFSERTAGMRKARQEIEQLKKSAEENPDRASEYAAQAEAERQRELGLAKVSALKTRASDSVAIGNITQAQLIQREIRAESVRLGSELKKLDAAGADALYAEGKEASDRIDAIIEEYRANLRHGRVGG